MSRTTIKTFLLIWKMHFPKLVMVVNHHKNNTYIFFYPFPSTKNTNGKKRPICPVKNPGLTEETAILAGSIPTCFSQKSHTQHLNLSFVSAVGFNHAAPLVLQVVPQTSIPGCQWQSRPNRRYALNRWEDYAKVFLYGMTDIL